jgi:predicted homoserine dehydrogenase-like protein
MGRPIRIGLIGAGTFGTTFLNQARIVPGMQVAGVADLDVEKAKQACAAAGWPAETIEMCGSPSAVNSGAARGRVMVTDDAGNLIGADLDVIVEATGVIEAGTYHAWTALEAGKHVVMGNVETDALLGHALKRLADERGLIYSLAYGDQPGIICEMIDWARTVGLEVVCAGKAPVTSPRIATRHPIRCGTISALPRNKSPPATTIPRCTTPSWTARNLP